MYDLDSSAEARRISDAAFQLLEAYEIPPNPDYFRLMYDYVSGRDPVVTRQLGDAASESNVRFRRVATDLLIHHYGEGRTLNLLSETGGALDEIVNRSVGQLAEAGAEAKGFSSELGGFAEDLDGVANTVRVDDLVGHMVTATRRMQAKCAKLETDLNQSGNEIHNLRNKLDETRAEALTDKLTGISNRAGFDKALTMAIMEARDEHESMTLVMCDIDHFKKFNDNYGHQVGDQVLRLVGGILRSSLKGQDIPCRYGGEEFAMILPRTRLQDAAKVAEAIRQAVERKRIVRKSTGEAISRVTMSFGVAEFTPGEPGSDLIERADKALYDAKGSGRNRVCLGIVEQRLESDSHLPDTRSAIAAAG
ncbi:MAG: GGDEF domain-containing protein [Minwuia sp.]|nr:GGDEF domain-containing protein [Minwuia sp.]